MAELLHKELTEEVLKAAIDVHRVLGPGLLESAYELCLFDKLTRNGLSVARQVKVPIEFEGRVLDCGYRIDLLIENKIIIEVNSADSLAPIHSAQLLTYMRLASIQVGFLMNFNMRKLMDGVIRLALSNPSPSSALSACSVVNNDH
ncbi:MAG TPA: GxxExxY protein [Phycisphaerales bacterium]|nr:GxxExxY protein [Phycisphaerales bacterium]HRQ75150.1 GxxExxY protein [Phycisphaerales bacterium]